MGRARQDRDIEYLAPAIPSLDASAMIAQAFQYKSTVVLLPGVHTMYTTLNVTGNLIAQGPAVLQVAVSSSINDTVTMSSDTSIDGVIVDPNIPAREAAGFAGYTHGIRAINKKNVRITNNLVRNAGETDAYTQLSTCGILVDRTASGTFVSDGIVVRGNRVEDPSYKLPFGYRMRADFSGITTRAASPWLVALVEDNYCLGTTKNGYEYVGPNTWAAAARNIMDMAGGQGGEEHDFGALGSKTDCISRRVGRNGVMDRDHDAFGTRCGEFNDGSAGLAPIGVKNTRLIMEDSQQVGAYFLRAFSDFGSDGTEWDSCRQQRISKADGASADRRVVYAINAKNRPVINTKVKDLSFTSTDQVVRVTDSTNGFSGMTFTQSQAIIDRIIAETPALAGQTFVAA